MNKEKIKDLVINEGLTVEQLIDVIIELNGIVGVGLITLTKAISLYINSKI